ncbi:hypothetical protein SDC9_56220 [bioreactor metagenome]|uniref:Regulatory protein YycH domain-containing protein n=1 Tax=bioreactor metagenome TaxID=1076179 RepID=A0A644X1R7_9ZZZZ
MMKRIFELIKSILLVLLVCATLLMSMQTLIFERLYPFNTGVFSSLRSLYSDLRKTAGTAKESSVAERDLWASSVTLLQPTGDETLFFSGQAAANQISAVSELAAKIISSGTRSSQEGDFAALITDGSLLFDLGRELTVGMFENLCGYAGRQGDSIRRMVLTAGENECSLSFESGNNVITYVSESVGPSELTTAAEAVRRSGLTVPVLVEGRMLSVGAKPGSLSAKPGDTKLLRALAANPVFGTDGTVQVSSLQSALAAFDYSVSTLRRDVEEDGTLVYVENYSNVRISPNGTLLYSAAEPRRGLSLSRWIPDPSEEGYTAYEVIKAGYALLDAFQPAMTGSPGGGLRYTGGVWSDTEDALTLCYDYVFAGIPVRFEGGEHAVTLTYAGGYFIGAKIHFRTYAAEQQPYYPAAVGKMFELAEISVGKQPTGFEFVYNDDGDGVLLPRYELTVDYGVE